ncbi:MULTISPECIES: helix-turn-helix domain-containing protein [Synechococcales]|uniref:helix-turn-helix domain-containing protein n=1 Tax=Synechococcus sp. CS-1324 TaxID=2847980 RepID=UPI0037DA5FD0
MPKSTKPVAIQTFRLRPGNIETCVLSAQTKTPSRPKESLSKSVRYLSLKPQWSDREYREAYLEASIEQGIAWQIRINRQKRGLSQKDLAIALNTRQSAISRLEDPEHGAYNLRTLIEIAKAFDCALSIRYIPYSSLAEESHRLSEENQFALPYAYEAQEAPK